MQVNEAKTDGAEQASRSENTDPSQVQMVQAMLERAQRGDRSMLPILRQYLDSTPAVWHAASDLSSRARTRWIEMIAASNVLVAESLGRQIEMLKAELSSPRPSRMEMLLVDRVAVSWLQLHWTELTLARAFADQTASARVQTFAQKRHELADRRYASSIAQLAMLQKMLVPDWKSTPPGPDDPAASFLKVVKQDESFCGEHLVNPVDSSSVAADPIRGRVPIKPIEVRSSES